MLLDEGSTLMRTKRVECVELTSEQRKLLCEVLNHEGERGQVVAGDLTLDYFALDYAIECTRRAHNKLLARIRETGTQMGDQLFAAQLDALHTLLKTGERCSDSKRVASDDELKIERCVVCETPTHPSESNDQGVCVHCMGEVH